LRALLQLEGTESNRPEAEVRSLRLAPSAASNWLPHARTLPHPRDSPRCPTWPRSHNSQSYAARSLTAHNVPPPKTKMLDDCTPHALRSSLSRCDEMLSALLAAKGTLMSIRR